MSDKNGPVSLADSVDEFMVDLKQRSDMVNAIQLTECLDVMQEIVNCLGDTDMTCMQEAHRILARWRKDGRR